MFSGCTKKQLDHVAALVTELKMPPGSEVMAEGSIAHEFIIIESGTAIGIGSVRARLTSMTAERPPGPAAGAAGDAGAAARPPPA